MYSNLWEYFQTLAIKSLNVSRSKTLNILTVLFLEGYHHQRLLCCIRTFSTLADIDFWQITRGELCIVK